MGNSAGRSTQTSPDVKAIGLPKAVGMTDPPDPIIQSPNNDIAIVPGHEQPAPDAASSVQSGSDRLVQTGLAPSKGAVALVAAPPAAPVADIALTDAQPHAGENPAEDGQIGGADGSTETPVESDEIPTEGDGYYRTEAERSIFEGSAARDSQRTGPSRQFPRSDVKRGQLIGSGAYGKVYFCLLRSTGELVAAKVVDVNVKWVSTPVYAAEDHGIASIAPSEQSAILHTTPPTAAATAPGLSASGHDPALSAHATAKLSLATPAHSASRDATAASARTQRISSSPGKSSARQIYGAASVQRQQLHHPLMRRLQERQERKTLAAAKAKQEAELARARHEEAAALDRRLVAWRVRPVMDEQTTALIEDLKTEIKLMASLRHPNVVRYMGCRRDRPHLSARLEKQEKRRKRAMQKARDEAQRAQTLAAAAAAAAARSPAAGNGSGGPGSSSRTRMRTTSDASHTRRGGGGSGAGATARKARADVDMKGPASLAAGRLLLPRPGGGTLQHVGSVTEAFSEVPTGQTATSPEVGVQLDKSNHGVVQGRHQPRIQQSPRSSLPAPKLGPSRSEGAPATHTRSASGGQTASQRTGLTQPESRAPKLTGIHSLRQRAAASRDVRGSLPAPIVPHTSAIGESVPPMKPVGTTAIEALGNNGVTHADEKAITGLTDAQGSAIEAVGVLSSAGETSSDDEASADAVRPAGGGGGNRSRSRSSGSRQVKRRAAYVLSHAGIGAQDSSDVDDSESVTTPRGSSITKRNARVNDEEDDDNDDDSSLGISDFSSLSDEDEYDDGFDSSDFELHSSEGSLRETDNLAASQLLPISRPDEVGSIPPLETDPVSSQSAAVQPESDADSPDATDGDAVALGLTRSDPLEVAGGARVQQDAQTGVVHHKTDNSVLPSGFNYQTEPNPVPHSGSPHRRHKSERRAKSTFTIFMELVPGGSIRGLLERRGALAEDIIRVYSKQLMHALAYLHANKIVHRDIKGANLLVSEQGHIKVADFGASSKLATIAEAAAGSAAMDIRGTPLFMAPEVIQQVGHGRKADIWSAGCTIIEMATSNAPWSEKHFENEIAAMFFIATTEHPPVLPDKLSPLGQDFVLRCLTRDPESRPTAHELLSHPFLSRRKANPLHRTVSIDAPGSKMQRSSSLEAGHDSLVLASEHSLNPKHGDAGVSDSAVPLSKIPRETLLRPLSFHSAIGLPRAKKRVPGGVSRLSSKHSSDVTEPSHGASKPPLMSGKFQSGHAMSRSGSVIGASDNEGQEAQFRSFRAARLRSQSQSDTDRSPLAGANSGPDATGVSRQGHGLHLPLGTEDSGGSMTDATSPSKSGTPILQVDPTGNDAHVIGDRRAHTGAVVPVEGMPHHVASGFDPASHNRALVEHDSVFHAQAAKLSSTEGPHASAGDDDGRNPWSHTGTDAGSGTGGTESLMETDRSDGAGLTGSGDGRLAFGSDTPGPGGTLSSGLGVIAASGGGNSLVFPGGDPPWGWPEHDERHNDEGNVDSAGQTASKDASQEGVSSFAVPSIFTQHAPRGEAGTRGNPTRIGNGGIADDSPSAFAEDADDEEDETEVVRRAGVSSFVQDVMRSRLTGLKRKGNFAFASIFERSFLTGHLELTSEPRSRHGKSSSDKHQQQLQLQLQQQQQGLSGHIPTSGSIKPDELSSFSRSHEGGRARGDALLEIGDHNSSSEGDDDGETRHDKHEHGKPIAKHHDPATATASSTAGLSSASAQDPSANASVGSIAARRGHTRSTSHPDRITAQSVSPTTRSRHHNTRVAHDDLEDTSATATAHSGSHNAAMGSRATTEGQSQRPVRAGVWARWATAGSSTGKSSGSSRVQSGALLTLQSPSGSGWTDTATPVPGGHAAVPSNRSDASAGHLLSHTTSPGAELEVSSSGRESAHRGSRASRVGIEDTTLTAGGTLIGVSSSEPPITMSGSLRGVDEAHSIDNEPKAVTTVPVAIVAGTTGSSSRLRDNQIVGEMPLGLGGALRATDDAGIGAANEDAVTTTLMGESVYAAFLQPDASSS